MATKARLLVLALAVACADPFPVPPLDRVVGTWGGDNAGLIGSDSTAHVHIGCTFGETGGPILPDSLGRFDVAGLYNVDAYPVGPGTNHPARFSGVVSGGRLTLTVTLTDTTRTLGPVSLTYGVEPRMGPCPICRPRVRAPSRRS